jgi:16S rRNA (cytidine1402-2'-O)-methyltransferase
MGRRGKKRSSGCVKPLSKPASHDRGQPTHGGEASKPPAGGLFVVATPIGNSADITLRALDTLRDADVIACEDTRITARLLAIHQIATALVPYHDHNAGRMLPALIKRLNEGEKVALVSDAGTPLISDPGYRLVRKCLEDGLAVTALPGASAVLPALVLSGLPTDRFLFAGFPPPRSAARKRTLESLAAVPATLVFLESARRLASSLADMAEILGDREAAVSREMTKMFEEVRRGPLHELAAHYALTGPPRGEVTVVVAPPGERTPDPGEVDRLLSLAMAEGTLRDAAARVAAATGLPRRQVYARALELRERGP